MTQAKGSKTESSNLRPPPASSAATGVNPRGSEWGRAHSCCAAEAAIVSTTTISFMGALYHEQLVTLSGPVRGASGMNRRPFIVSPRPHDMLYVWPLKTMSCRILSRTWVGRSKGCLGRWPHPSIGERRWEGPAGGQATTPTLGRAETKSTHVCGEKPFFPTRPREVGTWCWRAGRRNQVSGINPGDGGAASCCPAHPFPAGHRSNHQNHKSGKIPKNHLLRWTA